MTSSPGGRKVRPNPLDMPALALALAAFVFLAWRQHQLVNRYAVNVLYWDQWAYYDVLFQNRGWWSTFNFQVGPHRMGMGFVVTRILAHLSGWDSRWDAFGVSFTLILAAGLAWKLALRCGVRAGLSLIAIPLLFFNRHEYAAFSETANISHGAMPLLLIMLFCLAWFLRRPGWRITVLAALTFLLIFTGFGLFIGVIAPMLLGLEGLQALRSGDRSRCVWAMLAILVISAGWLLFLRNYIYTAAIPNFRFPYERPHEYFLFMAIMLANFLGVAHAGALVLWVGAVFAGAVLAVLAVYGRRIVRRGVAEEPVNTVIFALAAFEVAYLINTAIGRVMLGLDEAPIASRYVILMIPGGLAVFLALATCARPKLARRLSVAFALLLIPATAFLRTSEQNALDGFSTGRRNWKEACLRTHSESEASKVSHFDVFPFPVSDKLMFLETRHLNLFNGDPR